MLSFLSFVIAAVIFFLGGVNVTFPKTNQSLWGLFFLALGFVLQGIGPAVPAWRRNNNAN